MRHISAFITFLVITLLTACGGGGGSPGLSSGSQPAFSVIAPPALTLQVGSSQQYAIKGGVKPYSVFSSNPAVVVGWLPSEDVLAVGTVVAGTATVSIVDAKGTKVDIAVTAGSSTAFFSSVPAAITLAPGAAGAQTFQLGGGVPPYTATSSDTSIATVSVNGNTATITGLRPTATVATITFRDAAGATVPTSVTVATAPLAINPSSITAFISDTVFARISGGTPPYRVDTGVTDALTATITNQNEVTITLLRALNAYEFIVVDANNQTAKLTLNASTGTNVFRLSPATLSIAENDTQSVLLTMYGAATTGTAKVFSTNTGLLSASISGNTVTLTPSGHCVLADTPVEITVVDAKGAIGTATVTIKDSVVQVPACIPL